MLRRTDGWRGPLLALGCGLTLAGLGLAAAPRALAQAPSCTLAYDLPADLDVTIPEGASDGDFMQFAWQHFLALNAPDVGGEINPDGDNATQWDQWSSTADLLNQVDPGPPGSRFYPEVCQQVPDYQQYRVIQQVGKVDDSVLEADVGGLSQFPVVDRDGKFVRYEILLSPATYDNVVEKMWNQEEVLQNLGSNVDFICGDASYTGGDPADSQMGALVLKLAWRDAADFSPSELSGYHTENLLVYNPGYRNSSGVESCTLQPMALVGQHIAHKTVKQPNWLWMTFEHALNAPDCTSLLPAPTGEGAGSNPHCPGPPASTSTKWSFLPESCAGSGNEGCAACNQPPASNAAAGECDNPFMMGDVGWCLDLPPNPVGGTSQLCRQIPASVGHCSNDPQLACTTAAQCGDADATCDPNYTDVGAYNQACLAAIRAAGNGGSVWSNYELIGTQWLAESFSACQNNATAVAEGASGPVETTSLRELVTLSLNSQGEPVGRPILGNTSMESYDRANCIGCHARTYLDGHCSLDASALCKSDQDCAPSGGTCEDAETTSTDFMYFLNVEVAAAPSLRLPGTSLSYRGAEDGALGEHRRHRPASSRLRWQTSSPQVILGARGSANDPRCNGEPWGTVKARLDLVEAAAEDGRTEIDLPCQHWRLVAHEGRPEAYRYADLRGHSGPCRRVAIVEGRLVSASCRGDLALDLADEGAELKVVLSTGRLRYCTSHRAFARSGALLTSADTPPPDRCAAFAAR